SDSFSPQREHPKWAIAAMSPESTKALAPRVAGPEGPAVSVRLRIMSVRDLIPFGLASEKPRHFRDMARAVWENKDNLGEAWRVLNHGVCDGCSLGPYGLRDNVISGTHLCMTRLNLLRLNTMPAAAEERFQDAARLRAMSNEQLHRLGRLP